ncbi:MAG TPA: ribonuclease P protein subunit [Nitrosopumilaceae archaeon]|nr:ribonuclease P protein subunit [Nitrosopumilaceae archaeon]
MITFENISIHEMIGLQTVVSESTNSQIVGLTGTIVDETKSMFTLNTKNGFKTIPKKQNTWKFFSDGNEFTLSGTLLEKRAFDRLGIKL